jgi:hypothetical protein
LPTGLTSAPVIAELIGWHVLVDVEQRLPCWRPLSALSSA